MPQKKIIETFNKASLIDWVRIAKLESGQEDPLNKLKWKVDEKISFNPIYTRENGSGSINLNRNIRQPTPWGWKNIAPVHEQNESISNKKALELLNSGADGIRFDLTGMQEVDFGRLLHDVRPDHCELSFMVDQPDAFLGELNDYVNHAGVKPLSPCIFWCTSSRTPQAVLAQTNHQHIAIGIYSHSEKGISDSMFDSLKLAASTIDQLTDAGISPGSAFRQLRLALQISNSLLAEIARLRATRLLWANLAQAYGLTASRPADLELHGWVEPAPSPEWDPGAEMLHETAAAVAAVLGGCDALLIASSDKDIRLSRIAKNISLILQNEAMLDKVQDPVSGSYFLDTATITLAEQVWKEISSN